MSAKPVVSPPSRLYDEDFVLWTQETARLLRAGRFGAVDVEHVAEEIEDMGKRDRRALGSRLTVLIHHLLKWKYQEPARSRSWRMTMDVQRTKIEKLFRDSPSLRPTVPEVIEDVYPDAVRQVCIETDLPEETFPKRCPFTAEQILDRDFLPE